MVTANTTPPNVNRARWFEKLQAVSGLVATVISIIALVVAVADHGLEAREADRKDADLVTSWQESGAEAARLIKGPERVTRVRNKSSKRIDFFVIERKETEKFKGATSGKYFQLPMLPPCTILTFATPFDASAEEFWQWDDSFFEVDRTLWSRRDKGYLINPSEQTADLVDTYTETQIINQIEHNKIPSRRDDIAGC